MTVTINIAIAYNDKGEVALGRLEDAEDLPCDFEDRRNVRTVVINVTLPALEMRHFAVVVPPEPEPGGDYLEVKTL